MNKSKYFCDDMFRPFQSGSTGPDVASRDTDLSPRVSSVIRALARISERTPGDKAERVRERRQGRADAQQAWQEHPKRARDFAGGNDHEVPYPAAIAAGVKLVMVSWAIYPAGDVARPAGLSPTVVQAELRSAWVFKRAGH